MVRSPARRTTKVLSAAFGAVVLASSVVVSIVTPTSNRAGAQETTGSTVRVSAASGTDGGRELSAMSADGRYVVFVGRSNKYWGVYLYDQMTATTQRLTTSNDMNPAISANGRYVAYARYGSVRSVYLLDRKTGTTTLESATSTGTAADGQSDYPSVSADGRYVAFQSSATNLGGTTTTSGSGSGGSGGGRTQVYVHDNKTGTTTLVSASPTGTAGDGNSLYPDITPDGQYVAFASAATNLLSTTATAAAKPAAEEGETTLQQVFVRDLSTGTTKMASVSSEGVAGDASSAASYGPSISDNGNLVAFESDATNLVAGDTNAERDAFVHDFSTGATTRVSLDSTGQQVTMATTDLLPTPVIGGGPQISGDGLYVAFESDAALTPDDTNGVRDVYIDTLATNTIERVSVPVAGGTEATGTRVDGNTGETVPQINGSDIAISIDGRYVSFTSDGDLAGDRPTSTEEGTTETSSEPAIFVRTRNFPTVDSVTPSTIGRARVDVTVTVHGTNFTPPSAPGDLSVDLGPGVTINSLTWVSATELTLTVETPWNSALGARVPTVVNPGSDSARATDPNAFVVTPRGTGYRVATAHGGVRVFGSTAWKGSLYGHRLTAPVSGIAQTPSGKGYWLVTADGKVSAYGNATSYGSLGRQSHKVVGMAVGMHGRGYWLATSAGNVYRFGSVKFYGSKANKPINGKVVGIAAMPNGKGYWLVTDKGSVYAFGGATWYGSRAHKSLNGKVVGIAAAPHSHGYWLVTNKGTVYSFGYAGWYGTVAWMHLSSPIVGMTVRPDGGGYWLIAANGHVYPRGDTKGLGSPSLSTKSGPAVGLVSD